VEEEMINRFPIQFAKTTLINHDDLSSPKIIQSKNFPQRRQPNKEGNSGGSLSPPNALPRERGIVFVCDDLVKIFNIESPFARWGPPKLVLPFAS
jgi:hypothetical protein